MNYLRQSTASQEVLIGPFVSSTDGNTVVSGLTIANTDIKVWKTGATTITSKNSGGATHISNGLYYMTLDAIDTDTIGPMRLDVHVSGALACWTNCTVLDEAVYDVMFGTVAPSTLAAGALMGLADSAITSAKFAANAITAAATATDFGTEIAGAIWNANTDTYLTAGSFGEVMHPSAHGLAVAASANTITLDGNATGVAEYYDGSIIQIVAGTGAGQSRIIRSYTSQKVVTVTEAWGTNPVAGSQYIIRPLGDVEVGAMMPGIITSTVAPALANLDVAVGTRLATSGYIAPDNTGISEANAHAHAIDVRLPSDPADESLLEAAIGTRAVAGDSMALTTGAVDAIWDEPLTGATHNVPNSSGRRLRQIASNIILDGFVVSATNNTVTFDGDASTVDRAYDPSIISIVGGTGAGQSRLVLEYDGDTKTAIVDRNWRVNPNGTSEFIIVSSEGREHVNEGGAQGGSPSTIVLNANASSSDNAYVGQVVFIRSGTGEDQARRVTAYNGITKIATVEQTWDVLPDATSGYVMLPTAIMPPEYISDAVLSAIVEGTLSFEEWTRLVSSVLFGKISGAPNGPLLFRNIADTKDRITATVDEDGNRLSVTTDAT